MTEPADSPNWSLLPHNPAKFFGLGEAFDLRDLKRSYNALIRRFKPEKFPQEFQRIRAAFEQLDSELRYGHHLRGSNTPEVEYQWTSDAPPASSTADSAPPFESVPARTATVSLRERLRAENISDVYRELSVRADKSPFDYYALAVMSDVGDGTGNANELQFARWLLEGLAAHPNDVGLLQLVYAYLRGPISEASLEKLLVDCSTRVPEDSYFQYTEPLWRALLRSSDFSRFRTTLAACESNLKGIGIDSRLAFYIQMLKPAMWVADEAWIEDALGLIEHNFDRIPPFMDFDIEMTTRLRAYMAHQKTFATGHPMLRRLDGALRDYFSEEQAAGDRSVLQCQLAIAADPAAAAQAFSNFGDPAFAPFYNIWKWVSYDVSERHIDRPEDAPDENIWHPRPKTTFRQIGWKVNNSWFGIRWSFAKIGFLLLKAFICVAAVFGLAVLSITVVVAQPDNSVGPAVAAAVFSIGFGLSIGVWISRKIEKHWSAPFNRLVTSRCYHEYWQPGIIRFLSHSHITYQSLLAYINAEFGTYSSSLWVKDYIDQDFALPVIANAQRFVA